MTYQEFIQNILDTRGRFACGEEYHERHHILPKSLGGTNETENLIDLFAREHYVAHKLLALENPENEKLSYAWWMMSHINNSKTEKYEITPEEYEESRKKHSEMMSVKISGEHNPMYGRCGKYNPNYGIHWPEESIERMRKAAIERCKNPEYIAKLSASQKARFANPNNPHPTRGKKQSEEARRKNSEAHKGKKPSPEAIEKQRVYMNERWADPIYRLEQSRRMREVNARLEYKQKQIESHYGDKSWNAIAIINVDTRKVYGASTLVRDELGIDNSSIVKCCKGRLKHAGGYEWKYLYDYTLNNGTIIPGAITLGIITEEEALRQLNKNFNNIKGE